MDRGVKRDLAKYWNPFTQAHIPIKKGCAAILLRYMRYARYLMTLHSISTSPVVSRERGVMG
ncbi:MAG: hypothetical protein AAF655_01470 [Bacteroidota bacterium]